MARYTFDAVTFELCAVTGTASIEANSYLEAKEKIEGKLYDEIEDAQWEETDDKEWMADLTKSELPSDWQTTVKNNDFYMSKIQQGQSEPHKDPKNFPCLLIHEDKFFLFQYPQQLDKAVKKLDVNEHSVLAAMAGRESLVTRMKPEALACLTSNS